MKYHLTSIAPGACLSTHVVAAGPERSGEMEEQKKGHVRKFRAELISPADEELWKRGASNAGYHYPGCAKSLALMGEAFAGAPLTMMNEQKSR